MPGLEQFTLAAFVDGYIAKRGDVKPRTKINWKQARRCLVDFFGDDKVLGDINAADADDWRRWLTTRCHLAGWAWPRIRSVVVVALLVSFSVMRWRRRLISENPFGEMKGVAIRSNRSRDFFVSRETAEMVLAACPDRSVAAIVRPEPLRWAPLPIRTLGVTLGGRRLGSRKDCRPLA